MNFRDETGTFHATGQDDVGGAFTDVGIWGVDEGAEDVDGNCWEDC